MNEKMNSKVYVDHIMSGKLDESFAKLYGAKKIVSSRKRYSDAIGEFAKIYGDDCDISLFSVSGRSEISGNHTDHNRGRVIAASVDLDIIAVAAKTCDNKVSVKSRGFDEDIVSLGDGSEEHFKSSDKKFCSEALIRGVCAGFVKEGYNIGGFSAYTESNVLKGSGLSSSAAFEDMIGNILNHFYNDGKIDYVKIAQISQYSENVYFGKPCGLMDQVACAAGGFVGIDFCDTSSPKVERIDLDLAEKGYELVIINTGGNHADLNDDYASVPYEMKKVAAYFGKTHLRDVCPDDFFASLMDLRKAMADEKCGDRAILRAYHFFCENARVERQLKALADNDIDAFLDGVRSSGRSSFCWLQNIYTCKAPDDQGLSLALMMCEKLLGDKNGAWRVHGGGFAGTVQAFVPVSFADEFASTMEKVFGE